MLVFQTIMKDRWMNIGYEDDELKPYVEPTIDLDDIKRIEILSEMGYSRAEIEDSLKSQKYDDVYATYLLLGRRSSDVSVYFLLIPCGGVFLVRICVLKESYLFFNSRFIKEFMYFCS